MYSLAKLAVVEFKTIKLWLQSDRMLREKVIYKYRKLPRGKTTNYVTTFYGRSGIYCKSHLFITPSGTQVT